MVDSKEYFLLANPYHIKSIEYDENIEVDLDEVIIDSIKDKYKDSLISIADEKQILKKIESLCVDCTIKNTVKEVIDTIISILILEPFDGRLLQKSSS